MARRAPRDVLREHDAGEVVDRLRVADDLVRGPADHARQARAAVDLVNHHLEVDGVAGIRIARLGLVAQDALGRLGPSPAVGIERLVTRLAGRARDDLARRDRAVVWPRRRRITGDRWTADRQRADRLGQRRVEAGQGCRDDVLVRSLRDIHDGQRAARFGGRLGRARAGDGAGLDLGRVRRVLRRHPSAFTASCASTKPNSTGPSVSLPA